MTVAGVSAAIAGVAAIAGGDVTLVRDARWVAAAGAAVSPMLLISDLGRPGRFLNMLRVFKHRSPMSVGVWGLVAFSAAVFSAIALAWLQSPAPSAAITALAHEWQEASFAVECSDALDWLARHPGDLKFDVVFVDPPYDANLQAAVLAALATRGALAPDARVYVEHRAREPLPELPAGWHSVRDGRAGEVGYHLLAT